MQDARFLIDKLVYDKENNLLIIRENESVMALSKLKLDVDGDTLKLKLKRSALIFSKRVATVTSIALPSEIRFIKVKGSTLPISEIEQGSINPTIIFYPKRFPFTAKIRCYNR